MKIQYRNVSFRNALPVTIKSIDDDCSSKRDGFKTTLSSINPSLTAPTGPSHGISLTASANDAALMLRTSGKKTESKASILQTSCVSQLKWAGNSGRTERSISRDDKISFSETPNSLRRKFVGIRPAAAYFCRKSTVNGIKFCVEFDESFATAVTIIEVFPILHTAVPFANLAYFPVDNLIPLLQKTKLYQHLTDKHNLNSIKTPTLGQILSKLIAPTHLQLLNELNIF